METKIVTCKLKLQSIKGEPSICDAIFPIRCAASDSKDAITKAEDYWDELELGSYVSIDENVVTAPTNDIVVVKTDG